jgi:hypothetical protein
MPTRLAANFKMRRGNESGRVSTTEHSWRLRRQISPRRRVFHVPGHINLDGISIFRLEPDKFDGHALISFFTHDAGGHVQGSAHLFDPELQSNFPAYLRVNRRLQQHATFTDIHAAQSGFLTVPEALDFRKQRQADRVPPAFPLGKRSAVTGFVRTRSAPSPKAFRKLGMSSVALSMTIAASRLGPELRIRRASSSPFNSGKLMPTKATSNLCVSPIWLAVG